jgi:drug/metabolite transporter (DMT)-like permease
MTFVYSLKSRAVGLLCTFPGCMGNAYLLERIKGFVRNPAIFLTVIQYGFTILVSLLVIIFLETWSIDYDESIPRRSGIYLSISRISKYFAPDRESREFLTRHASISFLKLGSTLFGDIAYDMDSIPMPIHMIARSSSTLVTMLVGSIWYNRSYTYTQKVSSLIVTVGIVLCCVDFSAWKEDPDAVGPDKNRIYASYKDWFSIAAYHGLSLIFMTISQEIKTNMVQPNTAHEPRSPGYHWNFLFLHHVLALPMLLIISFGQFGDVMSQITFEVNVPAREFLWTIMLNISTQVSCLIGFFFLQESMSPLAICILMSIRKAGSILVSVAIFGHEWTQVQQIGTFLVIGGSLLYSYGGSTSHIK